MHAITDYETLDIEDNWRDHWLEHEIELILKNSKRLFLELGSEKILD